MDSEKLDVVIIGGGIAGLFTLAKCLNRGYRAVLLEKHALGGGQTLKSQGIIHGGTKYALLGKMTEAQRQIAGMPAYWRACLAGQGDVDLSGCQVLTDRQCMWAMPQLSSRITGFFASKMMKSRVETLRQDKPPALSHRDCRGRYYALDEPVLDTRSLVCTLAARYGENILTGCHIDIKDQQIRATRGQNQWHFAAEKVIVTAGEGNGDYAPQQLRPLHMIYVRVPAAFGSLYVHVLEASDKPRLTVSSYQDSDGYIWYLGGNVAEKGAQLSELESIALAKGELADIFPWLDFTGLPFASFIVNRAEGLADGKRPDTPTVVIEGSKLIAWPTKLALSPLLADQLLAKLKSPTANASREKFNFPTPEIANYPWINK